MLDSGERSECVRRGAFYFRIAPCDRTSFAAAKMRTMADQIPDFIRPGAVVEWDTWCGTAVALVTFVGQFHVALRSPDGVTDSLDASAHSTLAERVKQLRPSTREFVDKNPGYTSALWD